MIARHDISLSERRWRRWDMLFSLVALSVVSLTLVVLCALLVDILIDGFDRLNWQFITGYPSRFAARAGILPALAGSFGLVLIAAAFVLPVGVGAAVYLEEYSRRNLFTRIIELNIANLAAVPSIIYGILGLQLFARTLNLGRSLLAGGLTLGILVLPVVIMASREALRNVPSSIREAAVALGATKWEMVRGQVLPNAIPGIMTGCILAFSRAIGETAPLVTLGALTYVAFLPDSLFSPFTALPIQAFNWISRPQEAFHANAAAAIFALLIILLSLNATAIVLRNRFERRFS